MVEAIRQFPISGEPVSSHEIKSGHINRTFLITTDTGAKYILQRVNQFVFPRVDIIMSNMAAISAYLKKTQEGPAAMISYLDLKDGSGNCYDDGEGGLWRAYVFVDNSVSIDKARDLEDFYESAKAFGNFQYTLNGFPAEQLGETIKNFHNTPERYRQLREAMANNSAGRLDEVQRECDFVLAREGKASELQQLREEGVLPTRVTHNDTKINNVLFDADTNKAVCVIDLDTIMPGLSAYDFGDGIRFGASTAAEDEQDLGKVWLDLELYRVFVRGYLEACPTLTPAERAALPLGAYTMTIECGSRFLADYLNGDKYFSIAREGHNLDRARTQFKLIEDMEQKWDDMERIVREEYEKLK